MAVWDSRVTLGLRQFFKNFMNRLIDLSPEQHRHFPCIFFTTLYLTRVFSDCGPWTKHVSSINPINKIWSSLLRKCRWLADKVDAATTRLLYSHVCHGWFTNEQMPGRAEWSLKHRDLYWPWPVVMLPRRVESVALAAPVDPRVFPWMT